MRVEELMSKAQGCQVGASVREAARLMKDQDIGFVPVCDQQGKPVGAITDRDLAIRVLAEGRTGDEKVESCMTKSVVCCDLGDDVDDAERLMRENQVSRIMVCDDQGKLAGVISLADVAEEEETRSTGQTLREVKSDRPAAH